MGNKKGTNQNPIDVNTGMEFTIGGKKLRLDVSGKGTNNGDVPMWRTEGGTQAEINENRFAADIARLEEQQKQEESLGVMENTGRFLASTLNQTGAMIEDVIGFALDLSDDPIQNVFGENNLYSKHIIDPVDKLIGSQRASEVRKMNQVYNKLKTGNETLDYVTNVGASVGASFLGVYLTGGLGTRALAGAGLSGKALTFANAALMTGGTASTIGLEVEENVYRGTLDKYNPGLKDYAKSAGNKAYEEYVKEHGETGLITSGGAEKARLDAEKAVYDEYAVNNESAAKIAKAAAEKGRYTAMAAMAPALLLNLGTAGLFTKGQGITRNIIDKPSRIGAKVMGTEALQEGIEEGFLEGYSKDLGEKIGLNGKYTMSDAMKKFLDKRTWEEALIGAVAGGITAGAINIGTYNNRAKAYEQQQQTIQKWKDIAGSATNRDLIGEFTDVTRSLEEVAELAKKQQSFLEAGDLVSAQTIGNRALGIQAFQAFQTGTSEELIKAYESLATSEELDVEERARTVDAVSSIKAMEDIFLKANKKYRNASEVFTNRVNDLMLDRSLGKLKSEIQLKKLEANKAIRQALDIGELNLFGYTQDRNVEDNDKVLSLQEMPGTRELSYDIKDLFSPTTSYVGSNKKVWEEFRGKANEYTAVQELEELLEQEKGMMQQIVNNNKLYNQLTSKNTQKQMKEMDRLRRGLEQNSDYLNEIKGTEQYERFVEEYVDQFTKIDEIGRLSVKLRLLQENEQYKMSEQLQKQKAIDQEMSPQDTSGNTNVNTVTDNSKVVEEKAVGNKGKTENKDNSNTVEPSVVRGEVNTQNTVNTIVSNNPFTELPDPIDPFSESENTPQVNQQGSVQPTPPLPIDGTQTNEESSKEKEKIANEMESLLNSSDLIDDFDLFSGGDMSDYDLDDLSFDPAEVNDDLDSEAKSKIKSLVQDYVNLMKEELDGVTPSFESFIRDYITKGSIKSADRFFNVFKMGWELNKFPKADYDQVYKNIFRSKEAVANEMNTMFESFVKGGKEKTKEEQKEKINELNQESQEELDKGLPKEVDADGNVRFERLTFTSEDSRPKLAYSSIKSQKTTTEEDGSVVVDYEYVEEGLNHNAIVDPRSLLDPDKYLPGTELTIVIPEKSRLHGIVIPMYETNEQSPLYGTKIGTETYREFYNRKIKENPDFEQTQEYLDTLPMFIQNDEGVNVAQVHEPGWYEPSQFAGDIREARANIRSVRRNAFNAFKNNQSVKIVVTEKRGGTFVTVKDDQPLLDISEVSPESSLGVVDPKGKTIIVDGKPFKGKLMNNPDFLTEFGYKAVEIRKVAVSEGEDVFMAFPIFHNQLNDNEIDTVYRVLESFLKRKNGKKTADQIQLEKAGVNLNNFSQVEEFLKTFIRLTNLRNSKPSPESFAKQFSNSFQEGTPVVMTHKGGLVFGVTGGQTMMLFPNQVNTAEGIEALRFLKEEVLPKFILNGSMSADSVKMFDVNDNLVETHSSYSEFLKERSQTQVKTFDIGTEGEPKRVTLIQPVIHYDMAESLSRKTGLGAVNEVDKKNTINLQDNQEAPTPIEKKKTVAENPVEPEVPKPLPLSDGTQVEKEVVVEGEVLTEDESLILEMGNVLSEIEDTSLAEAVMEAEATGEFEFNGTTVEEKTEDAKKLISENTTESKEFFKKHIKISPDQVNESNIDVYLQQMENQISWVNEYDDDFSLDPIALTDEDAKELARDIAKIPGLSPAHQYQIVDYMFNKIAEKVKFDSGESVEKSQVISELKTQANNLFNSQLNFYNSKINEMQRFLPNEKVQSVIDKYELAKEKVNLVKSNIDILVESSFEKIGKYTGITTTAINKEEDLSEEDTIEDENNEKEKNFSVTALQENGKDSSSYRLRRFMSGIMLINGRTKAVSRGAMGVPSYISFDEAWDTTQALLADAPLDFEVILGILESNKEAYPWVEQLISKLKNADSVIQKEFVHNMGKHALKMEFVMYSYDRKTNSMVLKVYNTNSASLSLKLKNRWNTNLLNNSPLVNEEGGKYLMNKEVAEQMLVQYDSWFNNKRLKQNQERILLPSIERAIASGKNKFAFTDTKLKVFKKKDFDQPFIVNTKEGKVSVTISSKGEVLISKSTSNPVGEALVNFAQMTPADQKLAISELQEWTNKFGIELSEGSVRELFREGMFIKGKQISANVLFKESATSEGAFGLLGNWLREAVAGNIGLDLEDELNNPLRQGAIEKHLTKLESKYSQGLVTNSFRDGKKSIYGFTASKMVTDKIKDLKSKKYRDKLRQISFSSDSFWLDLLDEQSTQDVFEITHLGLTAMKEYGRENTDKNGITNLADSDHELTKLGFFQDTKLGSTKNTFGKSNIPMRVAKFLFPTMSDKTTMMVVQTFALDLRKHTFMTQVNGQNRLSTDTTNMLISQLVNPELKRIINFRKNIGKTNIKAYDKGATKFLMLPQLNNLEITLKSGTVVTLSELLNNTNSVDLTYDKIMELARPAIEEALYSYVSTLVNQKIDSWNKSGIVEKDGNKTTINMDKAYLDGIDATGGDKVLVAAFDFVFNNLISNANAFQTVIGDPAIYYKSKSSDPVQQSQDTFINVGKRLAAMIAPGNKLAGSDNESYIQIFLNDHVDISENIEYLSELLDGKKFERKEYARLLKEDKLLAKQYLKQFPNSGAYLEIEGTDAQEYTTWQEHLHILENMGRLGDSAYDITAEEIREAKEMFANEISIDKMSDKQKAILKKVLQPLKPVYTGQMFDSDQDVMRMMYIKSSSFPLLPQLTKGLELDKLRQKMEGLQETSGKKVRASYQTANKVGANSNALTLFNPDGTVRDTITDEELQESSLVLDRKHFRIQLDVPYKSYKKNKDTVSMGTQLMKLLFGNGVTQLDGFEFEGQKMTGKQLLNEFNGTYSEIIDSMKHSLFQELGLDLNGNMINPKETGKRVQKLLIAEAKSRGYSKQDLDSLKLQMKTKNGKVVDYDFAIPIWMSPNSNRFESLLNAIVTNRIVKLKFPGASYVAGSEAGFKLQSTFEGIQENKIVFTDSWEGELKAARVENGVFKPAQIIAPSKFRDNDGKLIDLLKKKNGQYVYVEQTEKGFKLKEGMISKDLLKITSFRTPTSGHLSASELEIVGFVPQEVGDLMIVPRNLTTQKGLDFDIDKETTYQYWHKLNDDGKITRYDSGVDTKALREKHINLLDKINKKTATREDFKRVKELDKFFEKHNVNKLIEIYKSVLTNPSDEMQSKINQVLSIDYAKSQAELIDNTINSTKDNTWFTPMSDEYQKQKMALGSAGKIGTGAYSLDVTFHSLAEQLDDKLQLTGLEFDENGKPNRYIKNYTLGEYTSDGTLGRSRTLDNSRSISEVLSERQNIATDNEKEQVMGRVNLNGYTLDADKAMSMLGFDKGEDGNSIAFLLLSQPVVKRYVELMENGSSNLAGYNPNLENEVLETLRSEFSLHGASTEEYVDFAENTGHLLTTKAMMANLTNSSPEIQSAALAAFLNFRDDGIKIRKIQTTLNVDSKGLGKSTLDVINKEQQLLDLITNEDFMNIKGLVGDVITIGKSMSREDVIEKIFNEGYLYFKELGLLIRPTTPPAKFAFTSVLTAKKLWRKHFPYDSPVFKTIISELEDVIGTKGESSDYRIQERTNLVLKEYKKFINSYAANSFYNTKITDSQNIIEERRRLFLDTGGNQSLASFLMTAISKNPRLKNNKLIKKFEYEINKKGDGPSIIKFNNTASGNFDEEYLNNAIIEMFEENYPVGIRNGKPYTSRMLAQDLVSYSLLEGGVQEAIQFIKYVPVSYLEKMNVPFVYQKFSNAVSESVVSSFIEQFRSLNAYLHPQLFNKANKDFFKKFVENVEKTEDGNSIIIPSNSVKDFVDKTIISPGRYHYSIRMKGGEVVLVTINELDNGDLELKIQKKKQFHGMTTYGSQTISEQIVREASNVPTTNALPQTKGVESGITNSTNVEQTNTLPLISELKLGENLDQTLDVISQNPEYSKLAKALSKAVRNLNSQVRLEIVEEGKGFRGRYSRKANVIQIHRSAVSKLNKKDLSRTILKESIHAIMDNELLKYSDVNGNLKTSNAPQPILNLVKLFNQIKRIPEFQKEMDSIKKALDAEKGLTSDQKQIYYGAYNIKEFVEMIMTQPEFQKKLGEIKTDDNTTLFQKFKEFVGQILELAGVTFESGTVTEKAISSVFESIDQRIKEVKPKPVAQPTNEIEKTNVGEQTLNDSKKIVKSLDSDNSPIKKYELFPGVYANKEQTEAIDKMDLFLTTKTNQPSVFVLEGRGGTGKTTIAKKIIDKAIGQGLRVAALAPTHVARGILVNSIGKSRLSNNGTVAGAIGLKPYGADQFKKDPRWKPIMSAIADAKLIIVDECSMISAEHLNEMIEVAESTNPSVKFIFMGDNVQLEPVGSGKDSPTFTANTNPQFKAKLVERMRQGEESPIVPITDLFANNIESSNPVLDPIPVDQRVSRSTEKGEVLFPKSEAENKKSFVEDFKKNPYGTKVIGYRNKTLDYWNNLARQIIFGNNSKTIMEGDLLLAKSSLGGNDSELLISNSEFFLVKKVTSLGTKNYNVYGANYPLNMYEITAEIDRGDKVDTVTMRVPGITPAEKKQVKNIKDAWVNVAKKDGRLWNNYYEFMSNVLDYEYGYAITSHKSQGATFDNVYVLEDDINSVNLATVVNRNKAKYVASSRPKKKLVMYSKKNGNQKAGLNLSEDFVGNNVPSKPKGFNLKGKTKWASKDQLKANIANAFVGYFSGVSGSSTELYHDSAREANVETNENIKPNANTVAFVSVIGNRNKNLELRKKLLNQTLNSAISVLDVGGSIVVDTKENALRPYNKVGEGEFRRMLFEHYNSKGVSFNVVSTNNYTQISLKIEKQNVVTPPSTIPDGFDFQSELEYSQLDMSDMDMAAEMFNELSGIDMNEFNDLSSYQVQLPPIDDAMALMEEAKLASKEREKRKNNLSLDPDYIINDLLQKGIINGKCD